MATSTKSQQSWDTVYSQVSFALGSNLEALELTGSETPTAAATSWPTTSSAMRATTSCAATPAGSRPRPAISSMGAAADDQMFAGDGRLATVWRQWQRPAVGGAGNDMLDGGEDGDAHDAAAVGTTPTMSTTPRTSSSRRPRRHRRSQQHRTQFPLADNLETLYLQRLRRHRRHRQRRPQRDIR